MKSSIILIEDRPTRQQIFTHDLKINLNNFPLLKNVCGGDEFHLSKEKISNEISFFDDYNVIMIHRSALTPEERNSLIEYVNNKSKTLIFFSGGISSTLIQKIGKGQLLTINSKDFYSENLVLFLENSGKEILELAFGKHWELNLLIGANEKIAYYILNYTKKPLQIILDDLDLPQWIKNKYVNIESGLVEKDQLISINKSIHTDIKKLLR
ncbi:MAG: hypothetical protein LC107_00925 [Chitinophagales bacterium]|nr:hypothetical protein [Chitinophagales bacterium]